jgi:SNF2 family DNA or RNA helicase
MVVLHANWTRGALHFWGESLEVWLALQARGHDRDQVAQQRDDSRGGAVVAAPAVAGAAVPHTFAMPAEALRAHLAALELLPEGDAIEASAIRLRLPADGDPHTPWPSDHLSLLAGAPEPVNQPVLATIEVQALALEAGAAVEMLQRLEAGRHGAIDLAPSVRYFIRAARLIVDLLAHQRFIPTLVQSRGSEMAAAWHPWLSDDETRRAVSALLAAMPPSVRAVVDSRASQPWPMLEEALGAMTDGFVRSVLKRESFIDALDGRSPASDAHVAWLGGLLGEERQVPAVPEMAADLLRDAGAWVSRLADTGQNRPLHLLLQLNEPALEEVSQPTTTGKRAKPQATGGGTEPTWNLSLHLQSSDDPKLVIDAAAIWAGLTPDSRIAGHHIDHPQELLLSELGRVSSIWPKIESALAQRAPTHIELTTAEAYEFLRDVVPVLEDAGVHVMTPTWWNQPLGRLGARLQIEPMPRPGEHAVAGVGGVSPASSRLGLGALVQYRWQIAIGDQPLSMEEFDALAKAAAPLVRVRGKWIEINPEQLAQAREFILQSPTGQMTLLEAIQTAHGVNTTFGSELPVFGMDAGGWVADVLNASSDDRAMPNLDQPSDFVGSLRPYQKSGLSWLAFLDQHGLGACLADDMGLGKTIQFIALLLHERSAIDDLRLTIDDSNGADTNDSNRQSSIDNRQSSIGPTLLIVPTSVVENWVRELARFAPSLTAHVHHGPDRLVGDRFVDIAQQRDLIITTYPLVARDHETLRRLNWHRVTLDEAQYIKNPPTKQTAAIRSLNASRRLALTGTPVENRLSELWSIMEFLNPGYLGPAGEFRRRFAVPVERHRNQRQAERLRQMVRPFILRRVKTDPTVIDDLPPLVETKEYATLTPEQAALYQQVVGTMLGEVDRAAGIQRRGLVLATLVKLKQICNHPAQFLSAGEGKNAGAGASAIAKPEAGEAALANGASENGDAAAPAVALAGENHIALRSGKARRLLAMLEEVFATGEKALIFTQFRQMGHLLAAMIQRELEIEPLFLHGGTPSNKRQHLIDRFQNPHGGAPVFILSLKAGGVGLNLTAASHVFHFDRWWNPAVENQATDRAFRIGQTRRVHVHKFVCVGTLEERIDQMIEQKTELAQNIIGAGEQWLTELSTSQLRDMLALRTSAMEGDA